MARLRQTMADYVVIAITPALIIALVGSLVFFLLAVFYQGEFTGRLHWVMACFVFAAVLIGRISIEEGLERAMQFGIALAIPVGIASSRFVEVQGTWLDQVGFLINWGLIALIWWCAHRLTWDCTVIDDDQDASGEGLLQTAGLEGKAEDKSDKSPAAERKIEGTTVRPAFSPQSRRGLWERYLESQRRPHAPGLSVVYFSLAALPLFGIGQWFIPATNLGGRRWAFWLLCVYVASGLGLLLTTSFLGLRRYLRQRRVEMPTVMANLWLGIGGAMILVLLVFVALLPRPSAEYAISELPFSVGSPKQNASRFAPVQREGTQDDQLGSAPDREPDESRETSSESSTPDRPNGSSGGNTGQTPPASSSPGEAYGGSQPSKSSTGQNGSQKSNGGSPKSQQPDNPNPQPKESSSQQTLNDPQQQADRSPQPPQDQAKQGTAPESQSKGEPSDRRGQQQSEQQQRNNETQPTQPSGSSAASQLPIVDTLFGGLAELLKWAFYVLVGLFVLYVLWRSRAEVLAAIRAFLAALLDFWNGLWGGKRSVVMAEDAEEVRIVVPPAPFSTYADPFASGIASRYSLDELVRYSFEAFEAWSREHGCTREPDQTPHELARDVAKLNASIATDARNLVELYARAAYAQGELPTQGTEQLRQLWQRMQASGAH